jgi:parallel beta-helix repeat protein
MGRLAVMMLVFAAWMLCAALSARAETYYADFDAGSDGSAGTSPEQPFKHCPGDLQAADRAKATALKPGDTVVFKGGAYYRGTVTLAWNGEAGKPITLDGNSAGKFGQGRAILDGSEPVAGWKPCSSAEEADGNPNWKNIVWAPAPQGTKPMSWNLCEGDELLYLAQQPNPQDPFWMDDLESYFRVDSSACTTATIVDPRLEELGGKKLIGGQLLFYGRPNWLSVCEITDYDPAANKITFGTGDKIEGLYPETRYALLNHVLLIDRAGEYCFDEKAGKIWVWPLTEGDLAKKVFTISTRKVGFDLGGRSHVTVQGFRIQKQCAGSGESGGHAIRSSGPATGVTIKDNDIALVRSIPRQGVISLSKCTHSLIEGNYLHENPFYRVMILDGFDDSMVRGNRLDKNGGTGIICYRTHRTVIMNNTIRRHLAVHAQGMAIYAKCSDVLIEANTSFDRCALTLQDGENFTVRNNVFDGGGGTAFCLWGGAPLKNVVILNNVLVGSSTGTDWSRNIALFSNNRDESSRFTVINNVVDGIVFEGNTPGEVSHNVFTREKPQSEGAGNLLETDLKKVFLDPDGHGYHLRPASPAIDAGADVTGLYPKQAFPDFDFGTDYDGKPRVLGQATDIGAYEFNPGDK